MSTIGEPPRLLPSLALTLVKRTPCGTHSRWAGWCRCMRPWYAQRPTIVRHTGTGKQARWKPSLSRTRRAPCLTDCFNCANFYINDSISFSTRYISFSKRMSADPKKYLSPKKQNSVKWEKGITSHLDPKLLELEQQQTLILAFPQNSTSNKQIQFGFFHSARYEGKINMLPSIYQWIIEAAIKISIRKFHDHTLKFYY